MLHRILAATALLIAVGACRPSGTYDLAPVDVTLSATTEQAVAAAVIDRRPYVLNGDESPDFLGTERGNWGGPKGISTESGRDLADELAEAVANSLASRGIAASALPPVRRADAAATLAAFQAQGADRLLLIEVQDWRTDVYTRVKLRWRLEATVYDRAGNALGRRGSQGFSPLGNSDLDAKYAGLATEHMSAKLSDLLNHPNITRALR